MNEDTLRKLEQAHSDLENAIGLSEIEEEGSILSTVSQSASTGPSSCSHPKGIPKEISDIDEIMRKIGELEPLDTENALVGLSEIEEEGSILSTLSRSASIGQLSSKSKGIPKGISDIDEIMRKIGELELPNDETSLNLSEVEEEGSILSTLSQPSSTEPSGSKSKGIPKKTEIGDIDEIMRKISELEPTKAENVLGLSERELLDEVARLRIENSNLKLTSISPKPDNSIQIKQKVELKKLRTELNASLQQITELQIEISNLQLQGETSRTKECELLDQIARLKSEIATIKVNNVPDNSIQIKHNVELGKLRTELNAKSQEVVQLHREISDLRQGVSRSKEAELLDQVSRLKTEITTLKRNKSLPPKPDNSMQIKQTIELEKLRTELNAKSQEVVQLNRDILNLQQEGEASRTKECELLDQISRLKSEIATIKLYNLLPPKTENSTQIKHKAELDKLRTQLNAKTEEVIQLQRDISDLKKDTSRAKECELLEQVNRLKSEIATLKRNRIRPPKPDTSIQVKHKAELEKLRTDLNVKSQQIIQFRREISNLKQAAHRPKPASAPEPIKQNEPSMCQEKEKEYQTTIRSLQEQVRLAQSELTALKNGKGMLEFRIRELTQELALARNLNKPENEILTDLAEKVDTLNSRYNYREKQLDVLLKIASKSGSYSNSLVNSILLGAEDDMGSLSPTTTLHLLIDNNDN